MRFKQAKVGQDTIEGDIVHSYRYEIIKKGRLIPQKTFKTFSEFYFIPMPEFIDITVDGLDKSTDYTIKIYPYNAYGKSGSPLVGTFSTAP